METDELQTAKTFTSNGNTPIDGTISYDYGNTERLTGANDTSTAGKGYTYDYDSAGQIRHVTAGSSDTYFGYDENGDLCWRGSTDGTHVAQSCPATPSGDTTINHDAAGENTSTSATPNTYDADQRASSLQGIAQSYFDDGNDLRANSGTGTSAINYTSGPLGLTARVTTAGATFYTRTPDGNLLDEHGAAGTNYYLTNYQHSITTLVSKTGDTINGSYLYSPYGDTTVNNESGGTTAANNPWRYTGGYQDSLEGDGYYHYGARYYAPANARWTQPDPKPGNINSPAKLLNYIYAGGDPVNNTDATGRDVGELGIGEFQAGLSVGASELAGLGIDTLAAAGSGELVGTAATVAGAAIAGAALVTGGALLLGAAIALPFFLD